MKAIHMTAPGPANEVLQLVDVPAPQITRPTQIRVQLGAAGVNPIDTKLRSRGVFYPDALPAILGCDGAGTVTETGTAVKRFRPGDAVWFCHGGLGGAPGNYAEFTVLEEDEAEAMPTALDFAGAAALPLVCITAWEALFDRAGLSAGQTVLIHAGAGGVGHVAIQLARSVGVYGHVVTLLDPGTDVAWKTARDRNLSIHFTLMLTPMLQDLPAPRHHQGEILRRCAQLVERGELAPRVDTILALAEAATAHRLIEDGHVQGKIVLLTA